MNLEGTIVVIKDTIQVSEKFSKREFVITDDSMHPQDICFQLTQDKCGLIDAFKIGDRVNVSLNLRGKPGGWTSPSGEVKHFNTIEAWRIEKIGGVAKTPDFKEVKNAAIESFPDDDLPF